MGFDLIAEGVETESQMATLLAMGVSTHQGYLWARPLPPEDIPSWLSKPAAVNRQCQTTTVASTGARGMRALATALRSPLDPVRTEVSPSAPPPSESSWRAWLPRLIQPPRQGIKPWPRKRAEPVWSPQNSPLRASSFPF